MPFSINAKRHMFLWYLLNYLCLKIFKIQLNDESSDLVKDEAITENPEITIENTDVSSVVNDDEMATRERKRYLTLNDITNLYTTYQKKSLNPCLRQARIYI